jgi:MFS family permease
VLGWSAVRFGLVAAVMTVTAIAGALLNQRIATRLGVRWVAAAGTVLLGSACLLLTRISADGSLGLLLAALLIFGAGMGAAAVCSQIAALTGVAEQDSGLAAGLVDTSFAVGIALGVANCSSVAAARTSAAGGLTPLALTSGQQAAFSAASLFATLGLIIALTLRGKRTTSKLSPRLALLATTSTTARCTSPDTSSSNGELPRSPDAHRGPRI